MRRADEAQQFRNELTRAEQRDRLRLAHVLHDQIQQLLVADGLEDVKDRIRQNIGQQLGVQHYVSQLRRQTYIDIRF